MQAASVNLVAPLEVISISFCPLVRSSRLACGAKKLKPIARICCQGTGALAQDEYAGLLSRFSTNGRPGLSPSEQRVSDVVLKQAAMVNRRIESQGDVKPEVIPGGALDLLNEAYLRCAEVCEEYAKTFYLGTMLMTPERRKAIWAIYVWCRRTDELVDGPNAPHITPTALDRWEQRLEDVFNGKPYDMFDAALADTVSKFLIDIQPFRDMIDGMRMDLVKARYENFDELYLYCYYVAGTVGLMSVPVMGIAPESKATTESVFNAALALGIANQPTRPLSTATPD